MTDPMTDPTTPRPDPVTEAGSGFPKKPEDCKRHRWLPVVNLRTLVSVQLYCEQCWHCGTVKETK